MNRITRALRHQAQSSKSSNRWQKRELSRRCAVTTIVGRGVSASSRCNSACSHHVESARRFMDHEQAGAPQHLATL